MILKRLPCYLVCVALLSGPVSIARSQETSLFRQSPPHMMAHGDTVHAASDTPPPPTVTGSAPSQYQPDLHNIGLASASWTYQPQPPLRTYRVHDIVNIRVDELARARADGAAESRRNTLYDAILKDWISFRDGNLRRDLQSTGDPRVNGQSNQLFRSDSSVESRESLAFSVAARVVDIQPNGNLVLEANKTIWHNDNLWETSLSGICRAQDIAVDNVVLSRDLLDLQIVKKEKGQLRDGYKRGWFTRWLDEFNPF